MNDRFLFRIFHKETNRYCSPQYVEETSLFFLARTPKTYIVEQCTGLKDKNGELIYEGDILATSNKDPRYDRWEPEDWGYTVVYWNKKDLCFAGTKWFIDGPEEESVFNAEFVEVVGNVHQNPELLEEEEK